MMMARPNTPIFRNRPRYYNVGSAVLNSGTTTFDINQGLNSLATVVRAARQRPYVHHFALRFKISWESVSAAASNQSIPFLQLLSTMFIKTSVPSLPNFLWNNQTNLLHALLDCHSVNHNAFAYLKEAQAGTTMYPPNYGDDSLPSAGDLTNGHGAGSKLIAGKPDTTPNDTWGCASMFMDVANSGGGNIPYNREYEIAIPVCVKSDVGIDSLYVDRLPLEMFTAPNSKGMFTIGYNGTKTITSAMNSAFTPCPNATLTVSLDAYVVFDLETDPFAHGVTWSSDAFAITTTGQTVSPDFYRQIAVYPKIFDIATLDTNGCMFAYFFDFSTVNWDADASLISWTLGGVLVWPTTSDNYARELVADYNVGERNGVNPALYYERGKGNVFTGALGGTAGVKNNNFSSAVTRLTFMPILPLAFTNPCQVGFAPGFFATPGDTNVDLQVSLKGWALTADMVANTRSIVLAGSSNWQQQRDNIRSYEVYGAKVVGRPMPTFSPRLDNPTSSRAALYAPVVPETAQSVS